jgi:bacterioferritin (cytochrome b1)
MIELLNEDLAREYQAIIAYTVYSQTMKGAAYNDIAGELELHAAEELSHAMLIAKQIDYFNGNAGHDAQAGEDVRQGRGYAPLRSREREA